MNLSQAEFAARSGLRVDTVQNWEESGADIEDPAALALLRVIEKNPKPWRGCSRTVKSREDR